MPPLVRSSTVLLVGLSLLVLATGCLHRPRTFVPRQGDEIVVAGQLFHTGTRVITWMDPGGYDAYRVERRFSPPEESGWEKSHAAVKDLTNPARYGLRREGLSAAEFEEVRGGGWDLPRLQAKVDQFVLHYDVAGFSRNCFKILHDQRGLSVHFMLDADGTIYQTLDLKERASHATIANGRSIGIEIANLGAYPRGAAKVLDDWYPRDSEGRAYLRVPERFGEPHFAVGGFVGRPARPEPVAGLVQGRELIQYDFTPQQYAALVKLTAALCKVFPRIRCDYPRDEAGQLVRRKLPDEELARYTGVLGHFHVQLNKTDPGPALDWDRLIGDARGLLGLSPLASGSAR